MKAYDGEHRQEVRTPDWVWRCLFKTYGKDLDKPLIDICPIDPKFDALKSSWKDMLTYKGVKDAMIYCNPPYEDIEPWIHKAVSEYKKHGLETVFLVPSATQSIRFHDVCKNHASTILFIKGYVPFIGYEKGMPMSSMFLFIGERVRGACNPEFDYFDPKVDTSFNWV